MFNEKLLSSCALLALFVACAEPPDSADSISQQVAAFEGPPSYDYQGEQISLEIDPARITVSLAAGASSNELSIALSSLGLGGAQLTATPFEERHLEVKLPGGVDAAEASSLVKRLRGDPSIDFVSHAYVTKADRKPIALHDRLVVHLHAGVSAEAIGRLNDQLGTRTLRPPLGGSEEYLLQYPPGVEPLAFARMVAAQPGVAWVDPDRTSAPELFAVPTDPYFPDQYYARSATTLGGVRVDTNVEWAWDLTYGAWSAAAGPLYVAVIDSGVETHHPQLGFSWLGYDAFSNSWSSWGCSDCATNPLGADMHGTAVAGLISAQHDGVALAGLAPAATLLPVRIFRNGLGAAESQIAMGIDAAWQNGAHVLSNSWGGSSPSNTITAAINRATTQGRGGRGSVVVFAAGNTSRRVAGQVGGVAYPARLSNVLAVGAINRSGGLTDYTPQGSELDIVAPSGHFTNTCTGDVITTDLVGLRGCNDGPSGDLDTTSTFSGTSAAAPQAAAVAAMVLSRNPTWTEAQVRGAITAGADPWGPANQFGAGKLNAYRALVGRVSVSILGGIPITPGVYTYSASTSGGVAGNSYQWAISYDGSSFVPVGTNSSSFSMYIDVGDNFTLQVTVTNGPDLHRASRTRVIRGPAPPCGSSLGSAGSDGAPPSLPSFPVPCQDQGKLLD